MDELITLTDDGTEQIALRDFTERAYLDYSMYVIMDRALPFLGDGLKPVQRRIIYAMSELGLKAGSKYKKSARTVGDVLGKFHPHGDSACYEAMVLMAQPFSYRYPLVDGQGNWGAPDDPKSFAAMRYTESRLAKYSEVLLNELGQGTVEWGPNFDGTLPEPKFMPARAPNILLNGASGIAVGMATDIPSHNLVEIINACIYLLSNPKADVDELMQFVPGPDFPTSAEIISSSEDLRKMYQTGSGSVRMRAHWQKEHGDIVIDALPYQVSGAKVMEQIAAQLRNKKLPMIEDLRDESDHEHPSRLVIVPRSNRVDCEQVMSHLFASTDLEKTYRVNMNVIGLDGRPQVKNLRLMLTEWLSFRIRTVRRRLEHRLAKIVERLHLLDGLLIAFLNIDEVIAIIRQSEHPKEALMERFGLTEAQAHYILETKLRQLARIEEMKIRSEQDELAKERDEIEQILGSKQRMRNLIKRELQQVIAEHGDDRRSPIVQRQAAQVMDETEIVGSEPVTVVLSKKGWVRAAKGHDLAPMELSYKSGDGFLEAVKGKSNQNVAFIDSAGRSYSLLAHTLPSARGQGEPLTGRFSPESGASFSAMLIGNEEDLWLLATDAGYGFVVKFADLLSRNKQGKAMLRLSERAQIATPQRVSDYDKQMIAVATSEGRMLIYPIAQLPQLSKGKGNKIIAIPSAKAAAREELLTHIVLLQSHDSLQIISGKRTLTLKPADLEHYFGERGRRGSKLPRGFQRIQSVCVVAGEG